MILLLLLFSATGIYAQTRISGTVTDAAGGTALPGVTVKIKGLSQGTVTDAMGKFQLEIPDKNATLIFSFTGFVDREVKTEGQTIVNVSLQANVTQLNEVVAIGYGSAKKSDLTGR